jgi:beta-carotene 3-hydroxylase
MGISPIIAVATVVLTVVAMEAVATAVHRYVMHGWGWGWHRSHHEPSPGRFERNDLYALLFGLVSLGLFVAGGHWPLLWWVGLGTLIYGILYFLVHDGLVHRRVPMPRTRLGGYLKRLVQAHRLHHSVHSREGAVSFGFLYAPPVQSLVSRLRTSRR